MKKNGSEPTTPTEPLERARLQADVAKQRVRIAKEELKRARKRLKEAKREAGAPASNPPRLARCGSAPAAPRKTPSSPSPPPGAHVSPGRIRKLRGVPPRVRSPKARPARKRPRSKAAFSP